MHNARTAHERAPRAPHDRRADVAVGASPDSMCSIWTVTNRVAAPLATHSYYAMITAMGSLATGLLPVVDPLRDLRQPRSSDWGPVSVLMLTSGNPPEIAAGHQPRRRDTVPAAHGRPAARPGHRPARTPAADARTCAYRPAHRPLPTAATTSRADCGRRPIFSGHWCVQRSRLRRRPAGARSGGDRSHARPPDRRRGAPAARRRRRRREGRHLRRQLLPHPRRAAGIDRRLELVGDRAEPDRLLRRLPGRRHHAEAAAGQRPRHRRDREHALQRPVVHGDRALPRLGAACG